MIFYIGLWIVNIFYLFQKKNNKIISFITFLLLGGLFVSNSGVIGDAQVYKENFEEQYVINSQFEKGYVLLERFVYSLGIHSYNGFLFFLFILGSFFWWLGVKKMKLSFHCLFAIIMPFIFPTYATTLRFFLASSLIFASICYLMDKKYFKSFLLFLMAGTFHVISYFYIFFFLCVPKKNYLENKKKKFLWLIAIVSIFYFLFSIIIHKNLLIVAMMKIITLLFHIDERKIGYTLTQTNSGGLIFLWLYLCSISISFMLYKLINKSIFTIKSSSDIYLIKCSAFNYSLNLLLGIVLPLLCMSLVFYRILIIGHITNALVLGIYVRNRQKFLRTKELALAILVFIGTCISWLIPELISINGITIKGLFASSTFFCKF